MGDKHERHVEGAVVSEDPFVSIVIPCLNEVKHIADVLDSILAQEYPRDRMEAFIADGMSEDGTREIVQEYSIRYPLIRLVPNPTRSESIAMNIGIQHARGDIIIRMDAHTTYSPEYVPMCVKALSEYDADIVGGIWKIVPQEDTVFGRAVAQAVSNRFGVGNAYYKTGPVAGPKEVDGVPYGAFRKAFIEEIGLYDERFHKSEDAELYNRVRASGGKVLLVPSIVSYYRVRSNFREFVKHSLNNGFLVTFFLKIGKIAFYPRHLVPLAFVCTVLVSAALTPFHPVFLWLLLLVLGAYSLVSVMASVRVAIAQKDLRYVVAMPLVFALLHWSYGLGSLYGLARVLVSASLWRRLLPGSRPSQ